MKKEIWKDIKGYEGHYQISTFGNVKSLNRNTTRTNTLVGKHTIQIKETILKPSGQRYLGVSLLKDGIRRYPNVHRLVAENWIPNPYNKAQVNHINGIKTDNRVENLEWVSNSENQKHAMHKLGVKSNLINWSKK
jgi:hypothetical protein